MEEGRYCGGARTGGADGVDEGKAARVRVVGAVQHRDGVGRGAEEGRHVADGRGVAVGALVEGVGVRGVEPFRVYGSKGDMK
jgi:hypothetical protein